MGNERAADDALRKLHRVGNAYTAAKAKADTLRAERDALLREAVDAGATIDVAGPACGLTPASAKFVLYGKAKRKAKHAAA